MSEETGDATSVTLVAQSILDRARSERAGSSRGSTPEQHERRSRTSSEGDRIHIETTAARIRRLCAEQAAARTRRAPRAVGDGPAPGPAETPAHAVRDLVATDRRCAARAQAVLGDEPARRQPAAARRGTYFDVVIFDEASPGHAGRRDPRDPARQASSSSPATRSSCRRPRSSSPSPPKTTTRTDERAGRPPLVGGTKGFESILDALGSLLPVPHAPLALPQPRRAPDRLLERAHLRPAAHHVPRRRRRRRPQPRARRATTRRAETNSPSPEVDAVVELDPRARARAAARSRSA